MRISPETVTPEERAGARYNLARTILEADNANDIITAMTFLAATHAATAGRRVAQGHQESAEAWTKCAEELFTVVACADLNRGGNL